MTAQIIRMDKPLPKGQFDRNEVLQVGDDFYVPTRHAEHDGAFYLTPIREVEYPAGTFSYSPASSEPFGTAYVPPHSSQEAKDIMGARYAWQEGGFWFYAHCSPDEQADFAADAQTFAVAQFSLDLVGAAVKVGESTNSVARREKAAEAKALIKFAKEVGKRVYDTVVAQTLGYYHRDEHHDHRRELAIAAITAVTAEWTKAAILNVTVKAQLRAVEGEVAAIKRDLAHVPTIETRAARVARLEAEKKAKEAAEAASAETPTPSDG